MKQSSAKKTAITGGIGSGKSEVMRLLTALGKKCISCDAINTDLMKESSYIATISREFPTAVVEGQIDRKRLAEIIFNDEKERQKLNRISHAIIKERLFMLIAESEEDVFVEVPLLNESDLVCLFHRVWIVEADKEKRVERIMLRDSVSRDFAIKKIASQREEHRYNVATATINNNFDEVKLRARIEELLADD